MNAADTTLRVLRWAHRPVGPPPSGRLLDVNRLSTPSSALLDAAGALAAVTAARWQLTRPPLGDRRPPGIGGLWLAGVVGGREADGRAALLDHCPTPSGAWDLILRHAICHPAMSHLDDALAEALRARSPLTGALDRPAAGAEDAALGLIDRWSAQPDGRRVMIRALAAPTDAAAVLRWRADVLDRVRLTGKAGRAFVYEVYEAAVVLHRADTLARAASAERLLRSPPPEAAALEVALALAAWWGPLWALRRSHGGEIKARPALDVEALIDGTRLHGLARQMGGQAA